MGHPRCTRRFLVGADDGAVEQDLGKSGVARVTQVLEHTLPHAELRPADVQVGRARPRSEFLRDGSPLGTISVAPDDGLDGLALVFHGPSSCRADMVKRVLEHVPLVVGQYSHEIDASERPKLC